MKKILYSLIAATMLIGCDTAEVPLFEDTRFIKFYYNQDDDEDYDNIYYSFAIESASVTSKVFEIPVNYVGKILSKDLEYGVDFDLENSTLKDGFAIEGSSTYKVSNALTRDTLRIKVNRTASMKLQTDTLKVILISNQNFEASTRDSISVNILISDFVSKPNWWTSDIATAYLGDYSEEKYVEFLKILNGADFGTMDSSERRYYALLFKKELEENPKYEADGSLMTVTVIG